MAEWKILKTVLFTLSLTVASRELRATRTKRNTAFLPGWKEDTNKAGFTSEEKQGLLNLHNDFRRNINATNMKMLTWDSDLETVAQAWASGCDHRDNNGTSYGENRVAQPQCFNETAAVDNWYKEEQFYNFTDNTCTGVCSNYIQVVLAETSRVGCGIKFCSALTTVTLSNAYFIVCNYDPGTVTGVPYEEGMKCSNCPADAPICENFLCDIDNSTTTSTSSLTTVVTEMTTVIATETSVETTPTSSTNGLLEVTTASRSDTSVEVTTTSDTNSTITTSYTNSSDGLTVFPGIPFRNSFPDKELPSLTRLFLFLSLGTIFWNYVGI